MDLSNLKPAKGSVKKGKRLGRGQGSGRGGTSTRGHKGAKSRSGNSKKIGFEGGQMPLQRRVPKYGFKNINRREYKGINLSVLQNLAEKNNLDKIDMQVLVSAGMVSKNALVKILGKGTLERKLEVHAHAFSKTAAAAIEAKKGTVLTEKHKKKLSISGMGKQKGKIISPEQRKQISERNKGDKNGMFGKHRTEEEKKKISEVHKGKTLSKETREKISQSLKKYYSST